MKTRRRLADGQPAYACGTGRFYGSRNHHRRRLVNQEAALNRPLYSLRLRAAFTHNALKARVGGKDAQPAVWRGGMQFIQALMTAQLVGDRPCARHMEVGKDDRTEAARRAVRKHLVVLP